MTQFVQHLGTADDGGQNQNRFQPKPLADLGELTEELFPVDCQQQASRGAKDHGDGHAQRPHQRSGQRIQSFQQRLGIDAGQADEQNPADVLQPAFTALLSTTVRQSVALHRRIGQCQTALMKAKQQLIEICRADLPRCESSLVLVANLLERFSAIELSQHKMLIRTHTMVCHRHGILHDHRRLVLVQRLDRTQIGAASRGDRSRFRFAPRRLGPVSGFRIRRCGQRRHGAKQALRSRKECFGGQSQIRRRTSFAAPIVHRRRSWP